MAGATKEQSFELSDRQLEIFVDTLASPTEAMAEMRPNHPIVKENEAQMDDLRQAKRAGVIEVLGRRPEAPRHKYAGLLLSLLKR